jgi:hypothetical protein
MSIDARPRLGLGAGAGEGGLVCVDVWQPARSSIEATKMLDRLIVVLRCLVTLYSVRAVRKRV